MVFQFLLSSQELSSANGRHVGSGRARPRIRQRSLRATLEGLECRRLLSLTAIDHGLLVSDPDYLDVTTGVKGATWLANADLAATQTFGVSGINPDGSMTWETALNWVAAMNGYNNGPGQRIGYLGHSNWTLPLTPLLDSHGTIYNPTVMANFGFNCDAGAMGQLFYDEFHGVAGESITSIHNASTALFKNFQPFLYWGGELPRISRPLPVSFTFATGFLGTTNSNDFLYALPEFPSDPTVTPDPAPINNIIPLQPVAPEPTLAASPDKMIVHDPALNINWLADADLAASKSFGLPVGSSSSSTAISINKDGTMNYPTAVAWIAAMNAADYLGHDNWRLPDSNNNAAGYYHSVNVVGQPFYSEMGELYYTELGGQAGSTVLDTAPNDPDSRLFQNFQPGLYWSETSNMDQSGNTGHKTFSFGNGYEGGNYDADQWFVIPVFDGNLLTVTNNHDSGPGSLRAAVASANPGDTIEFSPGLNGETIKLQSTIDISQPLYIVGPGANKLAISGQNKVGLFDIAPAATGTTIAGLTLENGQANQGGAVLDDGAPMILNSDIFKHDQAVTKTPGTNAQGGALVVLGETTSGMTVRIMACQFNDDAASGASGSDAQGGAIYVDAQSSTGLTLPVTQKTTFTGDSATGGRGQNGGASASIAGAAGQGGAVALYADQAESPFFSFTNAIFSNCSASGGQGGTGGSGVNGQEGAKGGQGQGGAIYYNDNGALTPALAISLTTFTSNTAAGGIGGAGGESISSVGGNGAAGGSGAGGALFVDFHNSTDSVVTVSGDTLSDNSALGAAGGAGAQGTSGGGIGAAGGAAQGGAIAAQITGTPVSTNLMIIGSEIESSTAKAGNGGAGGPGLVGGIGGNGNAASGGALYLDSPGATLPDAWTLKNLVISHNTAHSGTGGKGGAGRHGGNGGDSPASAGGGIADYFSGTLDILASSLLKNSVDDSLAGAAGSGLTPGTKGASFSGSGGGLYIDPTATADASPVTTKIEKNLADIDPDISGILGSTA